MILDKTRRIAGFYRVCFLAPPNIILVIYAKIGMFYFFILVFLYLFFSGFTMGCVILFPMIYPFYKPDTQKRDKTNFPGIYIMSMCKTEKRSSI